MRFNLRAILALAVAAGLIVLFLQNVDLRSVESAIVNARPEWLLLSLALTFGSLAVRSLRWRFLLEPIGRISFADSFRATAVGFAASALLPARAGEVIRPYFLARQTARHHGDAVSATAAFATVILERLLDIVTVVVLLGTYVFGFGRDLGVDQPRAFAAAKWSAAVCGSGAVFLFVVLGLMSREPARLGAWFARYAHVLPGSIARPLSGMVEKFAFGLGAVRRPQRLIGALLWSFPLWLSIAGSIWAVAVAFQFAVPFTGTFLLIALLVIGVAVPTPGSVGGFHEAFRIGVTTFYGAPDEAAVGAAIVIHLISLGPSLLLGLLFAAQEGLSVHGMRQIAEEAARQTA